MELVYGPSPNLTQDEKFRRMLLWSGAAHLIFAALALFAPTPSILLPAPTPVFIEVVSAPELAPAPPPPAAKPAQQKVDEVVIPKELPKVEPEPAAKPKPKPPPKVEKKAKPAPPSADDVLAKLRQKVESREGATPTAAATGTRGRVDPEMAVYQKKLRALFYANWAGSAICRKDPKPVNFRLDVLANGKVNGIRLTGSSGNRFCDESAERAIRKVDPLPRPPRGATQVTVNFDPLETR